MSSSYQFDGPTNPDFEACSDARLAATFIRNIDNLGRQMHSDASIEELMGSEDRPEDNPLGHRMTSWVEDDDQRFGQGFGIADPIDVLDSDTMDDFSIIGIYYKVNRLEGQINLAEDPKIIEVKTTSPPKDRLDSALETFDRYEMAYAISMLGKMSMAFATNQQIPNIENNVQCGVEISNQEARIASFTEYPGAA